MKDPVPQDLLREARSCQDCVRLMQLARKWSSQAAEKIPTGLQARKLGVLGSVTFETYLPLLQVCAASRGLHLETWVAPFGAWQQCILNTKGDFYAFEPDLILLHLTWRDISQWPGLADTREDVEKMARQQADEILKWCETILKHMKTQVFLTNFHFPPHGSLGNLEARSPSSRSLYINRINHLLAENAPAELNLVDVAGMSARHGIRQWVDPVAWHHARQPMSYDAMPFFAHQLSAVISAHFLGAMKCLILDLDNTLWGGVVADDGLDGIRLGPGESVGEAFMEFQRYLLDLRERGILLAVCSKNQESIAREAFEKHEHMLIRLNHLSAFKANFQPKADNVREIAQQLKLGIDAMVFVDDNPVERDQMRTFLPGIQVPEIPEDPSQFIRTLEAHHYFEVPSITVEDLSRAKSYEANQKRSEWAAQATDPREFLKSLEMSARLTPYLPSNLERVTQLVNKSNQFNLLTRRYSRAELEAFSQDQGFITLTIRLADRFGDNGLISAIHARIDKETLSIENWVMSCRVLDRGVEEIAMNHLVASARKRGCRILWGEYAPTPKNALVKDHYAKLGFQPRSSTDDGKTCWTLDLGAYQPFQPPITVLPEDS